MNTLPSLLSLTLALSIGCSSDTPKDLVDGDGKTRIEGTEPGDCTDGADNDGDTLFDCDDDGCAGAPDCDDADGDDADADDTGEPPGTCTGDFVVMDEADLAELEGCTTIEGGLSIGVYSEATSEAIGSTLSNLDGLDGLTEVTGDLDISGNAALTNLDGLSSLTSVGGFLWLYENTALTHVDGLSSLTAVGGNLGIQNSTALTNLDGLSSLTTVGGYLYIFSNPELCQSLVDSFVTGLEALGGSDTSGNADCPPEPVTCTGDFVVMNEADLAELEGCTTIEGSLSVGIYGADPEGGIGSTLSNLDGLDGLTEVTGDLGINENSALTNMDGLSSMTSVGGFLWLNENAALTNVDGLSGLTSVGGYLGIQRSAALTNVDGLSSLTSVDGSLYFTDNAALTNLDGLSSLTSAGGYLEIGGNAALCQSLVDGFVAGLEALGWSGSVEAYGNAGCPPEPVTCTGDFVVLDEADITELEGCAIIDGNLSIGAFDEGIGSTLSNLDGLDGLIEVTGDLNINENAELANVDGLSSLTSVGGYLDLFRNEVLRNVDGLSRLTSVGGDLYFTDNPALCQTLVDAIVDRLEALGWSGSVGAYRNADC